MTKTGRYDRETYETAIEAAAQALFLCRTLTWQWRKGSPSHRDKAIIMFVERLADNLLGPGAGVELKRLLTTGFREMKSAMTRADGVRF